MIVIHHGRSLVQCNEAGIVYRLIAAILWLLLPVAQAAEVRLASLFWPPYSGDTLAGQGISVEVARAAFHAAESKLQVDFYPWARAVATGMGTPGYAGYFPEYDTPEVRSRCHLSAPIGNSPLGLVYHIGRPFDWQQPADLRRYVIGVVQDYVNTTRFDADVAAGKQRVDKSVDDTRVLVKLAAGRFDAGVMDKHVYDYLLRTDKALAGKRTQLLFHPRLLEDKQLYICFRPTAEGRALAQRFNAALAKVDVPAIYTRHLAVQ